MQGLRFSEGPYGQVYDEAFFGFLKLILNFLVAGFRIVIFERESSQGLF